MILNEQKYSNKNRLYYHGFNPELSKRYSLYFLTTKLEYALAYTEEFNVQVGTIKAPLNIFNARSKIDFERLVKIYPTAKKYDSILKHGDWFITNDRPKLFEQIESLGYDGIFNFEHMKGVEEGPSIGLFDISNFQVRKIYGLKDLKKIQKFKDYSIKWKKKVYEIIDDLVFEDEEIEGPWELEDFLPDGSLKYFYPLSRREILEKLYMYYYSKMNDGNFLEERLEFNKQKRIQWGLSEKEAEQQKLYERIYYESKK